MNFEKKEKLSLDVELATDLSELTKNWLTESLQLAKSFELSEIITAIEKLQQRRNDSDFRLAFVGEFKRGKSYLINRLLARKLLPEGVTPTTAILTTVLAGSPEKMEVKTEGGDVESRDLSDASWEDLIGNEWESNNFKKVTAVNIKINQSWLSSLESELIDTPGIEDPNELRASLVFDCLQQCDGVVFVISATAPGSMTELEFLKNELIRKRTLRILIIISKLDTVPLEERFSTLDYIKKRVAKLNPKIVVLPSHPVTNETSETETLNAIRLQIENMVAKEERQVWRNWQIASNLGYLLEETLEIAAEKKSAEKMNEIEKLKRLKQLEEASNDIELECQYLELEINKRKFQCFEEIVKILTDKQEILIENLSFELSKTRNPKEWWEKDFPFRLRRQFTALTNNMEERLIKTIAKDYRWLQEQVKLIFARNFVSNVLQSKKFTEEIKSESSSLKLKDINRYRLINRIGSGAAFIFGSVLGAPIGMGGLGMILSTTTGVVGEQLLNKEIEIERDLLTQELRASLEKIIQEYSTQIDEQLQQLYERLLLDIKQEKNQIINAKKAIFLMGNKNQKQPRVNYQKMRIKALAIQKEINESLSKEGKYQ